VKPAHAAADYVAQAVRNRDLASSLRSQDRFDWAVTCLFYAAVHYVNAFLRRSNQPIPRRHGGHQGRLNIVQQDRSLREIYKSYRHLDDESRDARYELKMPAPDDYDRFLLPELERIRRFIEPRVTT
jgi:HEPN domain-containing protein